MKNTEMDTIQCFLIFYNSFVWIFFYTFPLISGWMVTGNMTLQVHCYYIPLVVIFPALQGHVTST